MSKTAKRRSVTKNREGFVIFRVDMATKERVEESAKKHGLKASEWCRLVVQRALDYDPDLLVLLREVIGTRRETRALVKELIQYGKLSTDRFNFLVTETEEKKEALAQKVLEQARKSRNWLPPTGDKE
jgi:antitoxin component of RelBE/YafQ-DinJ toxin-antitoxin module